EGIEGRSDRLSLLLDLLAVLRVPERSPAGQDRYALGPSALVRSDGPLGLALSLEPGDAREHRRPELAIGRGEVDLAIDGGDAQTPVDQGDQVLGAAQQPVYVDRDDVGEVAPVGVPEHPRPVRAVATRLGGRDGGVVVLGDDLPTPFLGHLADLPTLGADGPALTSAVLGDPHVGGSSYGHGANVTDECSDSACRSRRCPPRSAACARRPRTAAASGRRTAGRSGGPGSRRR